MFVESVIYDLRYALRMMRRAPLVTSVAVLSLALGIGANTAIFTVLDALLLKLLPVKDPRQIVMLYSTVKDQPRPDDNFSLPAFERFRQHEAVAAFTDIDDRNFVAQGRADTGRAEVVSGNYYAVLGVTPVLGRAFNDDDDRESAAPVCLISYRYWESRFGRDPSILGQTLVLSGVPFTVIGIEPKGFYGMIPGYAPSIRIPIHQFVRVTSYHVGNAIFLDPTIDWLRLAARVPRATRTQAAAEFNVIYGPRTVLLGVLALLLAAIGLYGVRAYAVARRSSEIGIRMALGADDAAITSMILRETAWLAFFGIAIGLAAASGLTQ